MQVVCGHQLKKMFYPQVQLFVQTAVHGFTPRLQALVVNGLGKSLSLFLWLDIAWAVPVNNFSVAAF